MTAFCLASLIVGAIALLLEATRPAGVLVVRARVWLGIVGAFGVWLLILAA
jgi:hypothetical protein